MKAEGFPLGMFPSATYEEFNVATQPGDAIVFVSDGILDAENEKGEMYGEDRLAALLCGSRDLPARHIADAILADVTTSRAPKTASTTKPSSSSALHSKSGPLLARTRRLNLNIRAVAGSQELVARRFRTP